MKKMLFILFAFVFVECGFCGKFALIKNIIQAVEKNGAAGTSAKHAGYGAAGHRFEQGSAYYYEQFREGAAHSGGPTSPHIDPSDFSYNPGVYYAAKTFKISNDSSEREKIRQEIELYINSDLYPKQETPRYKDEVDYIRGSMAALHRIGDFHPYQRWLDTHQDLLKKRAEENKTYVNQRYYIDFLPAFKH